MRQTIKVRFVCKACGLKSCVPALEWEGPDGQPLRMWLNEVAADCAQQHTKKAPLCQGLDVQMCVPGRDVKKWIQEEWVDDEVQE